MIIQDMPWDSAFLKCKVGAIIIQNSVMDVAELQNQLDVYRKNKYELIYLFDRFPVSDLPEHIIKYYGGDKMPDKLTFVKDQIDDSPDHSSNIEPYKLTYVNEKLLSLALSAGGHSRFREDTNFAQSIYKRLYTTWIERSVSGEISDRINIYCINNETAGFITVQKKENTAIIGLVAVDRKFQGKGVASALLQSVQRYALENRILKIEVSTQGHNTSAIHLYKKNGYYLNLKQATYHFWLNKL